MSATEMEMQCLAHRATLTVEQSATNEIMSSKPEISKPLQMTYIGPEDVDKMAMLLGDQDAP